MILRVDDVSKRYGLVRANQNLSFDVRRAETVAIVGESGCGKTTLARIVMGLERATSGSVTLLGRELGTVPVTTAVLVY